MTFDPDHLTGAHLRAARALLAMSGEDLAEKTNLALSTIRRSEADDGVTKLTRANAALLVRTLEAEGIRFLGGGPSEGIGVQKVVPL